MLAHLRIVHIVTDANARLTTDLPGSALVGRVSHPLDDSSNFLKVFASFLPIGPALPGRTETHEMVACSSTNTGLFDSFGKFFDSTPTRDSLISTNPRFRQIFNPSNNQDCPFSATLALKPKSMLVWRRIQRGGHHNMTVSRGHWGSRLGFVLAASGSAVGLGNLWKFPYITWENNGGAFVLVYLLSVVVLGLPIMMSEILIGRRAQLSPVPAFEKLGSKKWSLVGWLGVLAGATIQSYYMVIAGWSLRSFFLCLDWSANGYAPVDGAFNAFLSNGFLQIALTALFTIMTAAIVYRGIGGGIEKATKVMMPVLLSILLYLMITALTMEGRSEALSMIFVPDFSTLSANSLLMAMGQAFFSLSLGLGAMLVYGSYIDKKESIFKSAMWVVVLDTGVALVACITMFTIIFSIPDLKNDLSGSTVGMLFITLPKMFYTEMPGGIVLGPAFFILVAFAALSSTISLGEVIASLMIDRAGWSRPKATIVTASFVFVCSIFAALSLGAVEGLSNFEIFAGKAGVLSTLDHLVANYFLPIGGLFTTLFVGWKLGKKETLDELGLGKATVPFTIWLWIVRIVAPAAIIFLLINVFMGKDFS
jgi:neurotransmitter:Na+ symporter, NSS family